MVTGVFQLPDDMLSTATRDNHEWYLASEENWMIHEIFRCWMSDRNQDKIDNISRFSPILIWGPTGVGKSLLLSILNASSSPEPSATAKFCHPAAVSTVDLNKSRDHTRRISSADWVRACQIQSNRSGTDRFIERESPVCRLLVDDIHQLGGHEAAQDKLANSLDQVRDLGGVAVLTSQQFPLVGPGFLPRLTSRLHGGMVVELRFPGPSARSMIIHRCASELGWTLDQEAIAVASRHLPLNIRLLRGRLSQLLPTRPFRQQPLSASDFEKRLCIEHKSSSLSAAEIINVVAKRFQISARLIKGPSRRKNVVLARSVAIYLMRKLTDFPLKDIGKSFANRDHSTVLHSIHKIESALSEDMTVKRLVDELQLTIQPLISEQNGIF